MLTVVLVMQVVVWWEWEWKNFGRVVITNLLHIRICPATLNVNARRPHPGQCDYPTVSFLFFSCFVY